MNWCNWVVIGVEKQFVQFFETHFSCCVALSWEVFEFRWFPWQVESLRINLRPCYCVVFKIHP